MRTIRADNFIEHGFTSEDFEKLRPEVEVALLSDDTTEVDFHGVSYYTTQFMAPFAALTHGRAIVTGMTATGSELYGMYCNVPSTWSADFNEAENCNRQMKSLGR